MKVFVAGATGALGTMLVPQLVAKGHEVTGMSRTPSKQDALPVSSIVNPDKLRHLGPVADLWG